MSSEVVTRNDLKNILNELLPIFYPVGSYYETSDTTFNPNTEWGGTWELELAGQVHVSSGNGYTVAGAETNTSDGGSKYIQAHTHGTGNTTYTAFVITTSSASIARRSIKPGTSTAVTNNVYSDAILTKHADTGAVSGVTTGTSGNMQPYIVVNRWHRTA